MSSTNSVMVKDETLPGGKWEFDDGVTAVFDDMLKRSIPQYEAMRHLCYELGISYCTEGDYIVDLGSSRGEAVAQFIDHRGMHNHFELIEVSPPMIEALNERFKGLIAANVVKVRSLDLRETYPRVPACLTLCILTLQFTPIEYRQQIIQKMYDHTVPGGAVILVEKVLGHSAGLDKAFVDVYYDLKRKNGYTEEQIQRKRLSLEGVLVPVTAKWNEELLHGAGFRQVDCFWRWANFAGWIAIK